MNRQKVIHRVTLIGSFFDFILGVAKIASGVIFNLQSLVADGLHSLSDLLTDFFVLIMNYFSEDEPDENHPYGHEKIEVFSSLVIGFILFVVALGIIYQALNDALSLSIAEKQVNSITLSVIIFSLFVKEALYQYTYRWGKKLNSNVLIANAWHSRTDALSSLVVLIAMPFQYLGLYWVDTLAAIIVGLMIGKMGLQFIWENLQELIDAKAPDGIENRIIDIAKSIEGINNFHSFRTRKAGPKVHVEINIEVDPNLSVSEGHFIAQELIDELKKEFSDIDISVHVDTHNDQVEMNYPQIRRRVVHKLLTESGLSFQKFNIHYHPTKVELEIFTKENSDINKMKEIKKKLSELEIDNIQIYQHLIVE